MVLTLQQNVLSKNALRSFSKSIPVLTLQQNVLSKNIFLPFFWVDDVLTLQQNVLSKNFALGLAAQQVCFDFTTKCSFQKCKGKRPICALGFDFTTKCSFQKCGFHYCGYGRCFDFTTKCSFQKSFPRTQFARFVLTLQQNVLSKNTVRP